MRNEMCNGIMKRGSFIFLFVIISLFSLFLVSAVDFIPQGDINLKGTYIIKNWNSSGDVNASFLYGRLNWSWLQNIPSYVKDYATNAVVISADNITSGTISKDRLPSLDNFSKLYCGNITGNTLCLNFTSAAILEISLRQNGTVLNIANITGLTPGLYNVNFTINTLLELSKRQNGTVLNIENITGLISGLFNVNFTINTLEELSKRQNGTTLDWTNLTNIPDFVLAGSSGRVTINADNITAGTVAKDRLPGLTNWVVSSCSNITDYPICGNQSLGAIIQINNTGGQLWIALNNETANKNWTQVIFDLWSGYIPNWYNHTSAVIGMNIFALLSENSTIWNAIDKLVANSSINQTQRAIDEGDTRYWNASLGTANLTIEKLLTNQTAQLKNITQNETGIVWENWGKWFNNDSDTLDGYHFDITWNSTQNDTYDKYATNVSLNETERAIAIGDIRYQNASINDTIYTMIIANKTFVLINSQNETVLWCGNITGNTLCRNFTADAGVIADLKYALLSENGTIWNAINSKLNANEFNTTNSTLQTWILSINSTYNLQIILNSTGIYSITNESYVIKGSSNSTNVSWDGNVTNIPADCGVGQAITSMRLGTCTAFLTSFTESDPLSYKKNVNITLSNLTGGSCAAGQYMKALEGSIVCDTPAVGADTFAANASASIINITVNNSDKLDGYHFDLSWNSTTNITIQNWILSANTTASLQMLLNGTGIYSTANDTYASPYNQNKTVLYCSNITGYPICGNQTIGALIEINNSNIFMLMSENASLWAEAKDKANATVSLFLIQNGSRNSTNEVFTNWGMFFNNNSDTLDGYHYDPNWNVTGSGGSKVNLTTTTCGGTDKVSAINNATGEVTCTADTGEVIESDPVWQGNSTDVLANMTNWAKFYLTNASRNETNEVWTNWGKWFNNNSDTLDGLHYDSNWNSTANETIEKLLVNQTAQLKNITQNETNLVFINWGMYFNNNSDTLDGYHFDLNWNSTTNITIQNWILSANTTASLQMLLNNTGIYSITNESYVVKGSSNSTNVSWNGNITNFPGACTAGQAITQIATTPTCTAFLQSYTEIDSIWQANWTNYTDVSSKASAGNTHAGLTSGTIHGQTWANVVSAVTANNGLTGSISTNTLTIGLTEADTQFGLNKTNGMNLLGFFNSTKSGNFSTGNFTGKVIGGSFYLSNTIGIDDGSGYISVMGAVFNASLNTTAKMNTSAVDVYGKLTVMNNSVTKLNLTWFGRGCMYDNGTAVIGEYPCSQ